MVRSRNDPDQIYQLLLGLVSLFGGIWIRRLQSDIRDLEEDVDRIRDEYQRRDDALRDYALISDNIKDIKNTLNRILDKLDKKADRT
jgi:septation ring formation regulator EzrA